MKIFSFLQNEYDKIGEGSLFLKDLSWSFVGLVGASGVMFIVNIMFGRKLGPEQYGIASFILLAAQTLRPVFTGGVEMSLTKELATTNKKKEHVELVSSAAALVLGSFIFWGAVVYMVLYNLEGINLEYGVIIEIIIGIIGVIGIKFFLESIVRGLRLFKYQAIFKITESSIIFFAGFIMLSLSVEYTSLIISFVIGAGVVAGGYFIFLKKYLVFQYVQARSIKVLLKAGILFAGAASITSFILLSDRVLVGVFLNLEDLGIYSAYAIVSVMVSSLFATIINNVLFVHIARKENKKVIAEKIDDIFKKWFVVLVFFLFIFVSASIFLYGNKYEYNIVYSILFSVLGALSVFVSLYSPIITTYNNRVFKYAIVAMLCRALLLGMYYSLCLYWNIFSIEIIVFGLILDYILGFITVRYIISKYIN